MARRYVRDAKGRFASKGYSGQTGGRGARLKSAGKTRAGGGKRENLIGANNQTITSLPKGTIGKTQRLRNRSRMDMSGQQFASFEKGRKAAKADISRQKQEAWFKQTQKKLDNAPLAKEMSKAEFARRTGGKTRDDSMSAAIEMSRQPRGRTKAGDRRNETRLKKIQDDVRATDKAYDAAIKSKKIKAPTDSLARKAAGEASNPAVQAAKRLQAKTAAKRADRAASNIPMSGSRGRRLDAEISRNVKQQAATKRAESKARNRQFKSDQSRAKALRSKYGDQLAKDFAAKSGKKVGEVKAAIKGMAPSQQVKLLTKAGRQQRAQANLARTADTRNKPGSTMIRRPSEKQSKSNRRAQTAVDIYSASGSKRSQIIRNQNRLARTERAQNNQMRTREARLAEANATGLPMIKVTKPKRRKLK